jgi:kojibiose phosphorylase
MIEAFDGYFQLKDRAITRLDNNFMPIFPKGINPRNVGKTQLIKQADVVMLFYLFPDIFSRAIKKKSYSYYARRTMHKSSLSPSIHAIVGNDLGDPKAYQYFLTSLYADLKNQHGNAAEGMHAASLGGTWQAVIVGFCGVDIKQGILSFNPKIPVGWNSIEFSLKWKGYLLRVTAYRDKLELYYRSRRKKDKIRFRIYGVLKEAPANRRKTFKKKAKP